MLQGCGHKQELSRASFLRQGNHCLQQRLTCCAAGSGRVAGQSTLIRRCSAKATQLASHMQLRMQKASAGISCRAVATAQHRLRTMICRVSAAAPAAHRTTRAPPCSTLLQTLPMQRSWSAPSKWVQLASVAQHGSILRLLACQHFLRPWQSQDVAGCSSLFGSVPQASAPMQRAAITACCACATPACCGQVGFLSSSFQGC